MENHNGIVLCGFPGTGKRYALERMKDVCKLVYVDDTEFKWIGAVLKDFGLRYPKVYVNQIKKLQKTHDFILLPSDREIRDILKAYKIEYRLVYPEISLRNEYVGRAYLNKYNADYIDHLVDNWDSIVRNCMTDNCTYKRELKQHEYIGNYIMELIAEKDMKEMA